MTASRTAIGGLCGAGKTTLAAELAREMGCQVLHTDDFIGRGGPDPSKWGKLSAEWFDRPGPWVIEGVEVVLALSQRMEMGQKPAVDRLIWCKMPFLQPTAGQNRLNRRLRVEKHRISGYLSTYGLEWEEYDGKARAGP